jgi:diaminopimelate epimerase
MHGLGNDFVVFNAADLYEFGGKRLIQDWATAAPRWAQAICRRNFGVGADGIIALFDLEAQPQLLPQVVAQYPDLSLCSFAWTYFNSDGSWSSMCGNGLRCAALYLKDRGLVMGKEFLIATDAGPMKARVHSSDAIEIDFGEPVLKPSKIPISSKASRCIREKITIDCFEPPYELCFTAVGLGNPHCVIFDAVQSNKGKVLTGKDKRELSKLAKYLQTHPMFPEGVNVEFASITRMNAVTTHIYERGCEWTLACASGAAATVVAGVLEDKLARDVDVTLPGGELHVSWSKLDNHLRMLGPACEIFSGYLNVSALDNGALVLGKVPETREVSR